MDYTGEDLRGMGMKRLGMVLVWSLLAGGPVASWAAETCITQSQMKDAERDALAQAAAAMATKIQANDAAGVKAATIAEYQKDFSGMADVVAATAPKLNGAQIEVDQIYVLDASSLSKTAAGANPDAQFFCNLNQTAKSAEFAIPQLPPGRYGFAMVTMKDATPWRLSFLLRQEPAQASGQAQWLLAGFYPRALTAGGHEGLWYWEQARALAAEKQAWNAWLYYQEAQALLLPVNFVSSTNLDKLQTELTAAIPPAISGGLSADTPLVVKGAEGSEFRFTAMALDDSLHADKPDVAVHIKVEELGDAAAARKRNVDAATALVAAHPELRGVFHGVWVFADAPGQSPYGTEVAMSEIK